MSALLRTLGIAVLSVWLVTLGANVVIGQGNPVDARYAAMGALPATPAPLGALLVPKRDPFAADVVRVSEPTADPRIAPSVQMSTEEPVAVRGGTIAAQQVPDVASFTRPPDIAVIGVIVGSADSYALVEDGTAVEVVHVGDRVAGIKVAAIGPGGVDLESGLHFGVDQTRRANSTPQRQTGFPGEPRPVPAPVPVETPPGPIDPGPRIFRRPSLPPPAASGGSLMPPRIGTPGLVHPDGSPVTPPPMPAPAATNSGSPGVFPAAFQTFAPLFATPAPGGSK